MPDVKHFDPPAVFATVMGLFWRQGLASTGVQDVVRATGVNRSSLYEIFGGKKELYLAALDRYLDEYALPGFAQLSADQRGLPAVGKFFVRLIRARCSGERAGWGCMVVNTHTSPESADPEVAARPPPRALRAALYNALQTARTRGQLRPDVDIEATAGAARPRDEPAFPGWCTRRRPGTRP